jgi:hypothetical protein
MGNWLSQEQASSGSPQTPESKDYQLTNDTGKYKTSAWTKDFDSKNWMVDTKRIWERPLSALSCHMDLPRLGHKIQVSQSGTVTSMLGSSANKMETVREVLLTLAKELGESEEFQSNLKEKFYVFIKEDNSGDTSQQLKTYLEELIPADSKLCHVLSFCHQKIVFPAYYSIKENLFEPLPFQDKRGSWAITIDVSEGKCSILHTKIQIGRDKAECGEPEFTFIWELAGHLTGEKLEQLEDITLKVHQLTIPEDVPEARAKEIRDIFEKYYH